MTSLTPDPLAFLHDHGLLFEINRQVLHPLGLELRLEPAPGEAGAFGGVAGEDAADQGALDEGPSQAGATDRAAAGEGGDGEGGAAAGGGPGGGGEGAGEAPDDGPDVAARPARVHLTLLDARDEVHPLVFDPDSFARGRGAFEAYLESAGRRTIEKGRRAGLVIQTGPQVPFPLIQAEDREHAQDDERAQEPGPEDHNEQAPG